MAKFSIFLSTVTDDYGQAKRDFLRDKLKNLSQDITIQEDLKSVGGTTGDTLDDYIRSSAAVAHVIGPNAGSPLPDPVVKEIRKRHPSLKDKHDWLDALLAQTPCQITYTQLEAYLALIRDKPLFCFVSTNFYDPKTKQISEKADEQQRAHLQRLLAMKRYPETFENDHDLGLQIVVFTMPILLRAGIKAATLEAQSALQALSSAGVAKRKSLAVDIEHLPQTYATKLYGRDVEMAVLHAAWVSTTSRIIAFDAMGGAGKTALVYHFVQDLKEQGWAGAERVFAWSFYSQGSNEDRQTSADEFFREAIKFFSDGTVEPVNDLREKGVQLAKIIQETRALLILDGLEPLQYTIGTYGGGERVKAQYGFIKDPAVKALLSLLSDDNPGLVIVTTRIELSEFTANSGFRREKLDRLPLMDGIRLVRSLGVEPQVPLETHRMPSPAAFAGLHPPYELPSGYKESEDTSRTPIDARRARDLVKLVEDLRGHALALTLAGNYLAEFHEGDVRAASNLPTLPKLGSHTPHRDPYRVMRALEIAFARRIEEEGKTSKPHVSFAGRQLALLLFLGFFDRPIPTEYIPVIFPEKADALPPDVADLAEARATEKRLGRGIFSLLRIFGQAEQASEAGDAAVNAARRTLFRRLFAEFRPYVDKPKQLQAALGQLAKLGLLTKFDEKQRWDQVAIDCHPLVREYFGWRLRELDAPSHQAAHGRMYDHLRFKGLPEAFQGAAPYALLCVKANFPDVPTKAAVDGLIAGNLRKENAPQFPPSIFDVPAEDLRAAAALVDGPDWQTALDAFLPTSEAAMAPLFAAIGHGCAAGRYDEAWAEVYRPRITRGNAAYATTTLGLYGQELAALASFFEAGEDTAPFSTPSANLSPADQALALNLAGFRLRAIGRLEDAVAPMRAVSEFTAELGDWKNTAVDHGNLCELLLILGRLGGEAGAVTAGRQAIRYGDKTDDLFRRIADRTKTGPALHAAGDLAGAEALFRAAEVLQQADRPDLPQLYSMAGFGYGALLLARGRVDEVAERAGYALDTVMVGSKTPLDISLAKLTQARAALAAAAIATEASGSAQSPTTGDAATPLTVLTAAALDALRRANVEQFIAAGLLAHAEALWRAGDQGGCEQHLQEAEAIAARGPMPLFMGQAKFLRARMALHRGDAADAATHRAAAAELVDAHGWGEGAVERAVLDAELAAATATATAAAADFDAKLDAAITKVKGTPAVPKDTGVPEVDSYGKLIDGGWWGHLPRLAALLDPADPRLTDLQASHTAYTAERDAWLAAQQAALDAEFAEEDRHLADPAFRKELSDALVAAGYQPLDDTPLAEQRNDARQYLQQKRQARSGGSSSNQITADAIPDDMVAQALADPQMREAMQALLKSHNVDTPLDDLPEASLKAILADMLSAAQAAQAAPQNSSNTPGNQITPDEIDDDMVTQALANPNIRASMEALLKEASIGTPLDQLTPQQVRALLANMMSKAQAAQAAQTTLAAQAKPDAPEISDAVVAQIFADPRAWDLLKSAMAQNNLTGEPADLPAAAQRQIVEALVKSGAISLGEEPPSP